MGGGPSEKSTRSRPVFPPSSSSLSPAWKPVSDFSPIRRATLPWHAPCFFPLPDELIDEQLDKIPATQMIQDDFKG
jgi:hypothetical protein